MMSDCLGFAALGLCAYDPADPPRVYFSIGEATAALIITLMIPQFLRPIFIFRLANQAIRIEHIYLLVFIGVACVLIATVLPNIGIPRGSILAYPVLWEFVGGFLFLAAFGALAFALLLPAQARRGRYPKFARAAADLLAHADQRDRIDFSKDLLRNLKRLIVTASFLEFNQHWSAFFEFRYRREIQDAGFAWSLLQLVAEPQFCGTLVSRCPWDTAAMLHRISDGKLRSRAAEDFIREIARQAIIFPSSMMSREIGHTGFHAAPVLSSALFNDAFINKSYTPLFGLRHSGFVDLDRNTMDCLMHALRCTLRTVLNTGNYWGNFSLHSMEPILEYATYEVHRQIRADRNIYGLAVSIDSGLHLIIQDTLAHLNQLDPSVHNRLYVTSHRAMRPADNVLDFVSNSIVGVLCSFSRDFAGWDDVFWSTALHIINSVFECRFGGQLDGMDPLQQRVALKAIEQVSNNMDGFYPPLTRVLLSVLGSYDENIGHENPRSAFYLFKNAFYLEMMRFPALYETDPDKASEYLPDDVRFDPDDAAFVKTYRLGEQRRTRLRDLSIAPVSFYAARRNASE